MGRGSLLKGARKESGEGFLGDGEEAGLYRVTVKILFDAAHRLLNYEGKCRFVHGHSYAAIICFAREKLTGAGFVADFSIVKRLVKEWIDGNWDHAILLNEKDGLVSTLLASGGAEHIKPRQRFSEEQRVFVLDGDPTAERMAKYLFDVVEEMFSAKALRKLIPEISRDPVMIEYVSIEESPGNVATYSKESKG